MPLLKDYISKTITARSFKLGQLIGYNECSPPSGTFKTFRQGCGNNMPDLSDLVPFHSGQVENFNLLVLGQVQNVYFVFHILINYYEFTCCIVNSVDPDQLASSEAS